MNDQRQHDFWKGSVDESYFIQVHYSLFSVMHRGHINWNPTASGITLLLTNCLFYLVESPESAQV